MTSLGNKQRSELRTKSWYTPLFSNSIHYSIISSPRKGEEKIMCSPREEDVSKGRGMANDIECKSWKVSICFSNLGVVVRDFSCDVAETLIESGMNGM